MGINPQYNQEPEEEPQEVKRPRRELPSFPQDTEMDDSFGGKPKRSKSNGNEGFMVTWGKPLLAALVIGVIFALVISSGMTGLVTKSYDAKNWTDNTTALQQIKSQLTNVQKNIDTAMTNVNNAINQVDEKVNLGVSSGLAQVNSELSGYSSKIDTLQAKITDMQGQLNTLQGQVGSVSSMQTAITDMQGKVNTLTSQISTLQTSINTANSKIATLETKVAALEVKITETPTTTPPAGSVSGGVAASFYNSPMVFVGLSPTGSSKAFGLKLNNGSEKDLVYVTLTITIQSSVNPLTVLSEDPVLLSKSGAFIWSYYPPSTGNRMIFNGEGYIYVPAGGEMADIQTLTLKSYDTMTGSYTMSVVAVSIDAKTLQ